MKQKTLQDFLKLEHDQYKCIVLGNSTSATLHSQRDDIYTIGVNAIEKHMTPDTLLIVDRLNGYSKARTGGSVDFVRHSNADNIVFFDANWGFNKENSYQFKFGCSKNIPNIESDERIDIGLDSPYLGIQLAYKMGFKHIGLLGVDFTNDHFYDKTGVHCINKHGELTRINSYYEQVYLYLKSKKVLLHNLSRHSLITAIPHYPYNSYIL